MTDNTAQNKSKTDVVQKTPITPVSPQQASVTTGGKEHAPTALDKLEASQKVKVESEIPKETEKVPVEEVSSEAVQISQDLQNIGIAPTGLATPVPKIEPQIPVVKLPVEDETVVLGLHADVSSTLRWLALWCIRKLAKAHIALKVIHGKLTRVKTK